MILCGFYNEGHLVVPKIKNNVSLNQIVTA